MTHDGRPPAPEREPETDSEVGSLASAAIARDHGRQLDRLEQLVRLETPTGDAAASAAIAALLARWWRGAGAVVRLVETDAGTSLVADVPGEGAPVLFVGHSDTVWPIGALDGSVPWRHAGDVVRGPGVYDMKSGLIVMLAAVEAVRARRHRAVRVVIVADEEVGSPTTRDLLRETADGVDTVLGFESPHPDGAVKIGRRGSTRLRLCVRGRAAHAALDPQAGVSAIDELVDQLVALRAIVSEPALPGEVLCNIGTVAGGSRANVVAADAEAEIGLRFEDAESEDRVLAGIRALSPVRAAARLEIELISHRPAWSPSDRDAGVTARLSRAAAACGQRVDGRPAAGAGDTNLFGAWGLPVVDGLGPRGGGAHAVDEHILVSSLVERIALLTAFLADTDEDM